jgi:hypothetical protein
VNTNAAADTILEYLETKHSRSYRNSKPQNPDPPYVVFRLESGADTCPSDDLYLNIDVYDLSSNTVRAMEDIADLIDGNSDLLEPSGLNHRVINTAALNLQFEREQRQYVPPEELVSTHLVNLRYVVRAYFK